MSDYLGRDVSADDGALACVDAACEFCRDVAEQSFNAATSTVYLDGSGTDALLLPEFPVSSAGTVAVQTSLAPSTFSTLGSTDYSVSDQGVLLATNTSGTSLSGTCWPTGRQNIRVTYDHGYTLGTAGDLPSSVRMVALSLASRMLVQGPARSQTIGDTSLTYAGESTALMPTERLILRKHKRTR